jgi:ABC-type microcin C transport system permease subunit YejB
MAAYLIRRLLLIIPTLWAIITINFFIVQIAPGGPVDQAIATIEMGQSSGFGGGGTGDGLGHARTGVASATDSQYRGSRGLDPEVIAEITKRYGFDKPLHERYFTMLWNYMRLDFGDSLFRGASVMQLVGHSLPVSITLGLWSTLIIYLVSIPLGIRKAVHNGSAFDTWSSTLIIIGYAIPAFLFAILMIVLFAGGSFLDWFPLRGLVSSNFRYPAVVQQNHRLPVAYHPARSGDGDWRFRHPDHADQEFVPRRDPQTVRGYRPRQRVGREQNPLSPRVSQCHAAGDRRLPGDLCQHVFHRFFTDRGDVLA